MNKLSFPQYPLVLFALYMFITGCNEDTDPLDTSYRLNSNDQTTESATDDSKLDGLIRTEHDYSEIQAIWDQKFGFSYRIDGTLVPQEITDRIVRSLEADNDNDVQNVLP